MFLGLLKRIQLRPAGMSQAMSGMERDRDHDAFVRTRHH
jgi:hypothetical protein